MWATREVLGVKLEATYNDGTTIPAAAADAVMVEDLNWSFADARMHERNPVKPTFGALGDLYAGALIEITGKVELKGSGTAGTPRIMSSAVGTFLVPSLSLRRLISMRSSLPSSSRVSR